MIQKLQSARLLKPGFSTYRLILGLLPVLLLCGHVKATQLNGSYTIDSSSAASATNFQDFSSAVTYMTSTNSRHDGGPANSGTVGVSGPVVFNVAAGTTYTLDTALVISAVPGASLTNSITFKRNGKGANPLITAYSGSRNNAGANTTYSDAMVLLNGASFITFDGIDLRDAPGNTTLTTMMEIGYYFQKASDTQGSQHDTIRNCTVTMQVSNTNYTYGLLSHWQNTDNIQVIPTSFSGTSSYNAFEGNTINNCIEGIFFVSTSMNDIGNDIGSIKGNRVNMANTAGPNSVNSNANAILGQNQNGISIQNNIVSGYFGANSILPYGIFLNGGDSATSATPLVTINNNDITLEATAPSAALIGISTASVAGSGYRMNITNNRVHLTNTHATYGYLTGILNGGYNVVDTVDIHGNTISNCTLYGSNTINGIEDNSSSGLITEYISGNTLNNNIKDSGSSGDIFLVHYASNSGADITENNNLIDSNTNNNAGFVVGIWNAGSTNSETINNNAMYALSNTDAQGTYNYGLGTSVSVTGIFATSSTNNREIHLDSIYSLTSLGGFVNGIQISGSSTSMDISRNKIYGLSQTDNPYNSAVYGLDIQKGDSVVISNNLIGNLTTTTANNSNNGLIGMIIQSPTVVYVFYNTVYLNDTTSSRNTAFGCQCLYSNTATTLTLNNNIFVNTSVGGGGTNGYASCIGWNGVPSSSYTSGSNNNLLYAGTLGAPNNNYLYNDNTNLLDSLSAYLGLMSPSDASSVTENPPFITTNGASGNFLHINPKVKTKIESGGAAIPGYVDDYDAAGSRPAGAYPLSGQKNGGGKSPDIGADEFDGIPAITPKSWIGVTSTDWHTATNWYGGIIPTATINVQIPSTAPYQPVLNKDTAICNSITIDTGASLTISGGLFLLSGNLNNHGTYTHSGGEMLLAGSKAQSIISGSSLTFFRLNSGNIGTKAIMNVITISDSLIIADSLADHGNVITAKGSINNKGVYVSSGSGKMYLSGGSSAHTLLGNGIYGNMELDDASGAISSGNSVVNGSLILTKGTLSLGTKTFTSNSITISSPAGLTITGGAYYLRGDISNSGTYTHTGGTMYLSGAGAQAIHSGSALNFYKLNASGMGTKTFYANATISDSLIFSDTLADNGNVITAKAGIKNTGLHLSGSGGSITMANGASVHHLMGNGSYTNLTVNDTAGAILSGNPLVNGTLTLTKGNIRLGNNKLIISSAGNISSASAASYIITNGTGKLYRAGMDTTAFNFPVGTSSSYAPVIFDDSLNSNDSISVRVQAETSAGSFTPALPSGTVNFVGLQWQIDEANAGGSNAKLTMGWNAADETGTIASPLFITESNGSSWTTTKAVLGSHKAMAKGFTTFSSPFAIYAPTITGLEEASDNNNFKTWYNRSQAQVHLEVTATENSEATIRIMDMQGRLISMKNTTFISGTNALTIPMPEVSEGIYWVVISSSQGIHTLKFIK